MLCSLFTVYASAEGNEALATVTFTDVSGLPCETAVNALAAAGIVNGRSEGIYAPNEGLTRAEMTAIILRAFGSEEIEDIEKFKDVPPTHWAYIYVETAYKMGIVNGMTETTFVPDGSVTYEQAIKMLVCAIDKENTALKEGGWPDGYIKVASDLGALEGVDGQKGQAISRGTMAQMVYNFLEIANNEFNYMYDWENEPTAEHYDWIREDRIRGIYGGMARIIPEENGFREAYEAGANAFFLNPTDANYEYKTFEGFMQMLDDATAQLHRYEGVHPFVKLNYGDDAFAKFDEFGQFHPGIYMTEYYELPCPLQYEYWEKQFLSRCTEIAKRPEWQGIIFDFEMHHGLASYPGNCMCDKCWLKFCTDNKHSDEWKNVPAAERSDFIVKNGIKAEHGAWFKQQLIAVISKFRETIHEINPEIIFGYMPGYESFLAGVTHGFGTPERPVLVMSEQEYWGCYSTIEFKMRMIKEEEQNALYACGLYTDKSALLPEQFEEGIDLVSASTAGYWIYNERGFISNEEYAVVLDRANKKLDADLDSETLKPLPEYTFNEYTATMIAGDTPTEAEWDAAPLTEDFVHYKDPEVKTVVTTNAKILYSKNDLFVRVFCYDDMESFTLPALRDRDKYNSKEQCVEVYWKFQDENTLAQYVTDASGNIYDMYSHAIGQSDTSFNYEFEPSIVLKDDHWEVTMRIPGSHTGVRHIQKGDILKMQISRNHPATKELTGLRWGYCHAWEPTQTSFLGSSPIWGTLYLD